MDFPSDLPQLDAHAHIATDLTARQAKGLGGAVVFAVTRTLQEARRAPHGVFPRILWGAGTHPGDNAAGASFSIERFRQAVDRFALIGEVGLDRRAGDLPTQIERLTTLLELCQEQPVILSVHSTGCVDETLQALGKHPLKGAVMHWFTGTPRQADQAAELGAWFSVNAAMRSEVVQALPRDRVLTETDFPFTRKHGASRPGDTTTAEQLLASAWSETPVAVRQIVWRNFASLASETGAMNRLPIEIGTLLTSIATS